MRANPLPHLVVAAFLSLSSFAFAQSVQLSEFLASNVTGILDEDGTRQDWIEIRNPSLTAKASLNSWRLRYGTSSPVTWTFPNVELPPGERILVWASGKNRLSPTAPLHTNFVLTKDANNLSLLNPAGAVISDFGVTYPAQVDDVSYGRDPIVLTAHGFYTTPTPEEANNFTGAGVAGRVTVSAPNAAFSATFAVTLSETAPVASSTIRFTIDGTMPTATSTAYTAPINIVFSTILRARVFTDGLLPGETETRSYLRVDASTANFSSAMPMVVISNFSRGQPPDVGDQPGYMWVFNPGADGRARFTNAPDIATRVVMDRRGSSTLDNPKYNLNIESRRNRDDNERDIALLGMPSHSDWVFNGPYNFDRSLLHNPFAFALSNRIGRYATRLKEAEVFIDVNGGALSFSAAAAGDYFGVYNVSEKIRRGSRRVDVRQLNPYDNGTFEKTGGYIVKVDRRDPGDAGFTTPHEGSFAYYYPREIVIKIPQRAPQDAFIRSFLTQFDTSLYNIPLSDPTNGYRAYLDVDAAIDHHLVNVWTFNVDALRLSGYMHKERGGKLVYGPVWDFDRSLSSTDGRDANPAVWRSTSADQGTDFFNYTWWNRLFSDIEFYQEYIDRWTEIRRGQASQANINSLLDSLNAEISAEAITRDLARWNQGKRPWPSPFTGQVFPASQAAEVQRLKDYLQQRANFMDSQWVNPVAISPAPGNVPPGTAVTLSVANPAGVTIVYTTNGSDPRPVGGGAPNPATSTTYTGTPIPITATTTLRARAYKPTHTALVGTNNPPLVSRWSGDTTARFSTDAPAAVGNLVVTEVNYHPTGPTVAEAVAGPGWEERDFEFIELRNNGAESIDLADASFTAGISYTFAGTGAQSLSPGEYVIVASNPAAFQARYGVGINVVGPWTGDLANEGERIVLAAAGGAVIVDLTYSDAWYPVTDGGGATLEYIGTAFATADYNNAANWRPSLGIGGSPDGSGLEAGGPIVINEVLSNSLSPLVDAVELHNPSAEGIDISGWYLSDSETLSTTEDLKKYRIPNGTVVPPGGYVVFTEQDFNPNGAWNPAAGLRGPKEFAFDADHGDTAVLVEANPAGTLIRFADRVEFGAARVNESWGRWPNGAGGFYPMAQQTLLDALSPQTPWPGAGGANSEPRVGPLVISEIHHTPDGNDPNLEFIEIYNPTDSAQGLANWQLRGDADFDFTSEVVPPGGLLVLTAFAPTDAGRVAAFRAAYGISDEVVIAGPWVAGNILLPQGRVVLYRAETPPPLEPTYFPQTIEDESNYASGDPWPETTNGNSLNRLPGLRPGDDPAGWNARTPNPGRAFNAPPIANADEVHLPLVAGVITIDVLANDLDADDDSLTITATTDGAFGTVQTNGSLITFTPGGGYVGNDAFTYTIADGFGGIATASVSLINVMPDARDDFASSDGGPVTVAVLSNDTDADLDPLAIASVTAPAFGTAEISGGSIVYTPGAGFAGDDGFSYVVSDGYGGSASASVVVRAVTEIIVTEATTGGAVPGKPGATFSSLGVPAIGDDGSLSWLAKMRVAGSQKAAKAIFGGIDPAMLFEKGAAVPGVAGATFKKFSDPVNDGAGRTVFVGTFKGPGIKEKKNDTAIFGATAESAAALIARTGDAAFEFPGAQFKSFTALDADAGETLYAATLKGVKDRGVWAWDGAISRLVLRSGTSLSTPVGAKAIKSFSVLPSVEGSSGHGRNHRAGEVALNLDFTDGTEGLALATFDGTTWTTAVFAVSNQATGFAGTWDSFGVPALSTAGDVAALCRLAGAPESSDDVIARFNDGAASAVAREGEASPVAGTFFKSFADPVANFEGTIAFTTKLSGGALGKKNDEAILQYDSAGLATVVAREQQPATEATGALWKEFVSLALPSWPGGGSVFLATLSGGGVGKTNDLGLWAQTTDGQLILLARTGEAMAVGGSTRILSKLALLNGLPPVHGSGRSYNDAQRIAFLATFTDGSQAIQVIRVP